MWILIIYCKVGAYKIREKSEVLKLLGVFTNDRKLCKKNWIWKSNGWVRIGEESFIILDSRKNTLISNLESL